MASRGLGSLTLDLIAKVAGFTGPLSQAERAANKNLSAIEKRAYAFGQSIGKSLKSAATQFLAFAGVTLTVSAAVDKLRSAIDIADETRDLSIRLGVSTETLSGFRYAAQQTGTDMDTLAKGLKILAKNAADAQNPTSEQAKVFEALGVKVTDASGKLKDLSELVPEIADKFKSLEDGTTKAALAQALLGKSGLDLTEFLNQGSQGLETYATKLRELGGEITPEAAANADEFNDKLNDLGTAVGGVALQISAALLPELLKVIDNLIQFTKDGTNAKGVADGIADSFHSIAEAGQAIGSVITVLQGVRTVLNGISDQASAAGEALLAALDFNGAGLKQALNRYKEASKEIEAGFRGEAYNRNVGSQFQNVVSNVTTSVGMFDNVKGSVSSSYDADYEKKIAKALSNPTAAKSGGGSKTAAKDALDLSKDAREELDKLIEQEARARDGFDQMAASLAGPLQSALYQYQQDQAKLNELAKEGAIDTASLATAQADLTKQYNEDVKAIQARLDPAQQVIKDMQDELALIGLTNVEREKATALRYADVTAMSDQGQQITALVDQMDKAQKSADFFNDTWSDIGDAFVDVGTRSKGALEAVGDVLDNLYKRALQFVADQAIQSLLKSFSGGSSAQGATGDVAIGSNSYSAEGGSSGGFWASLIGSLFGGGKAGGGTVMPGKFYEVGENDRPEMLMMRGKQYMIPGNQGTVTPIRGHGGVTNNNQFIIQASRDSRTQEQIAAKVGYQTNLAVRRNG